MNRPVGGWLDMQNSRSLMNNLMKLREWSFFLFNSCNMMCLIYDYKLSVNKCPGLPTYYVFTCVAKILPFSFSRISFRCKIGQHASRLLWLPSCTCHQIYRAICHGIFIPIGVGYKWACVQRNVSAETCNEKGWPRDPKIEKIIYLISLRFFCIKCVSTSVKISFLSHFVFRISSVEFRSCLIGVNYRNKGFLKLSPFKK